MSEAFREPAHWIVRTDYVFLEGEPTVDDVDAAVYGELLPPYGGIRHAIGNQPYHTTLEWRVLTLEAARAAVERLAGLNVIRDVRVATLRDARVLEVSEFSIRASEARGGRAICVACGARIPPTRAALFALEGAALGNEITLRCDACNFPMSWLIVAE